MKVSEQLKAAKAIIDTPEKWTTGTCARAADGVDVGYMSDEATCFCSFGAILAATTKVKNNYALILADYYDCVELLKRGFNTVHSIGAWNDSHTHAEVMQGFDNAIALAIMEEENDV